MNFSFLTASRIVCKSGIVDEIGPYVNHFGKKFLIVTDRSGLPDLLHQFHC